MLLFQFQNSWPVLVLSAFLFIFFDAAIAHQISFGLALLFNYSLLSGQKYFMAFPKKIGISQYSFLSKLYFISQHRCVALVY